MSNEINPPFPPLWCERTHLLMGDEAIAKLNKSHVLVVGLGGVGAYAAEMICRAGVGTMTIVDGDIVEESNINRQLPATTATIGRVKTEIMKERLLSINPNLKIEVLNEFLRDERMRELLKRPFDYVVDAIDSLSPKVYLIAISVEKELKIVSSLGSGGRLDPSQVQVADISESYHCALARALRKRLHRMGIRQGVKVVFSPENVSKSAVRTLEEGVDNHRSTVGTISYMPAVFGCFCASVVIRDLCAG